MKTFIKTFFLLFCVIPATVFSQKLIFHPFVDKPKEYQKGKVIMRSKFNDELICYNRDQKKRTYFLLDSTLTLIKTIRLPEEYKKWNMTIHCRLGNNHIISLNKGLRNRMLGVMDENFNLVKTYPLGRDFAFELCVYSDTTYAYFNINGKQLVKIDKDLNILSRNDDFLNFFSSGGRIWKKGEYLYIDNTHKFFYDMFSGSQRTEAGLLFKVNTNNLQDIKTVDIGNGSHFYGTTTIGQFYETEYNNTHKIIASLRDYEGKIYCEHKIEYTSNYNTDNRQFCDIFFNKENDEYVLAQINHKWQLTNKQKIYDPPTLIFYILSKNGVKSIDLGELDYDFSHPLWLLDYNNDTAHVLIGGDKLFRLQEIDLKNKTTKTLIETKCERDFSNYKLKQLMHGKYENNIGWCLDITQNLGYTNKKENAINIQNAIIFVNKDFSRCEIIDSDFIYDISPFYTSYYENKFIGVDIYKDFFFIKCKKQKHDKGLVERQLWFVKTNGYKLDYALGLDNVADYDSNFDALKVSDNEYYYLEDKEKQFRLIKLQIK